MIGRNVDGRFSRRVGLPLVVVALSGMIAAACADSEAPGEQPVIEWMMPVEPAVGSGSRIFVELLDPSGRPLEGAEVILEGTMTHPGMQPVLEVAQETSPGRYEAILELTMAGDWVVLLEAKLSDGRTFYGQHELPGVAP